MGCLSPPLTGGHHMGPNPAGLRCVKTLRPLPPDPVLPRFGGLDGYTLIGCGWSRRKWWDTRGYNAQVQYKPHQKTANLGEGGRGWATVVDGGRGWASVGECGREWSTVVEGGRGWATVGEGGRVWATVVEGGASAGRRQKGGLF